MGILDTVDELIVQLHEAQDDINVARCMAEVDSDSEDTHDPDWSRLVHGKIYRDGHFGEKRVRFGEWKDYNFGKSKNKMPKGWKQSELFDLEYRGYPVYDFIKSQKMPQESEDLYFRIMRRFNMLSRDNNTLRLRAGSGEEKKKRLGRDELSPLHPRVEEAMGYMFEDMAKSREFRYRSDEEDEY